MKATQTEMEPHATLTLETLLTYLNLLSNRDAISTWNIKLMVSDLKWDMDRLTYMKMREGGKGWTDSNTKVSSLIRPEMRSKYQLMMVGSRR